MIQLEQIKQFFPEFIRTNPAQQKYMLKEYIQLMILDFLSATSIIEKIVFIDGKYKRLQFFSFRFPFRPTIFFVQ